MPFAAAQLNYYAEKAGLKYFGSATDTPGQRERAGYDAQYPSYNAILTNGKEFGGTTPTNGMKWLFTEPEKGVFNFTEGDVVARIAEENNMVLRCHNLVWHSQLPSWVENTNWTADELRSVITNHITHVASHWKGRCYAWDVVNEALNDDGTFRESIFYNVLGVEYIKLAFRVASQVDPHAKLYYNDYNLESPGNKSEAARNIVKLLREDDIRIDGIGMQAHLIAEQHPSYEQHVDVIKSYTELDVEVALTELDIRLLVPTNDTNLAQQTEAYTNIVKACVKVKGCIGITVWDYYDPFSWVPATFPGQGSAALWFQDFTVHPAYFAIIDVFKKAVGCKSRRSWGNGAATRHSAARRFM
ncbi:hypothetical protein VTK73DRAFT_5169 [Phialemonium thermophilum]|uniref:Beta-xylanase n=1 Tax=Phialemonium thermophilum TaxID=223376 RepID=A0ABR3XYG0_9PEZI